MDGRRELLVVGGRARLRWAAAADRVEATPAPQDSVESDETADGPVGVLMLTKGLGRGGTERLLVDAVRHLDPARYRVEVAYLLPWKDALVDEIRDAGVPVHCLDAPRPTSVAWLGRLRQLVRDHDIAIVHTHMPSPAVAARLALGPRRPAIVHTEHNLWGRYRPLTRWANRLTYRRNRAVIAVSDGVAASIRSRVPVDVVLHGVEADRARVSSTARAEARARLGLGADEPVVGTVGNFTAKKDHANLLRAVQRVRAEIPTVRVVLIGSGPLEADLRRLVAALGLHGAVVFAGSRDDVPELLPAFDVFALSSRFEGLPIALLEAMSTGLACVATTVGGIPEVLTDGHDGRLVPPDDPDRLAAVLGALIRDPVRRAELGRHAAERASDFDVNGAVRQIERVYDEALARC
jgi:glycosyltransferase involved in cell wall biosynthesis